MPQQGKQKRIAFVYDAVYPFIKGGAERRYFEIGKRLSADGYDVHWYGMKSWDGPRTLEHEGMTIHGICRNIPMYTDSGRRSITQAMRFGMSCFKLLGKRFDVVDCCGFPYFSLFPARLAAWLNGAKLYTTWHEVWGREYWNEYLGKLGWIGALVEKIAVCLPDEIISVSQMTTERIVKILGRKKNVSMIPNGINLEKINAASPSQQKSDVIFTGRLLSNKNLNVLIEAIALVKKIRPSISLVIVGDGPEKENLEKLSEKLSLQNNVLFTGFLEKEEDVYGMMKSSRVFAFPSTREGFGIAVVEANASGLPAIVVEGEHNAAKGLVREGENGMRIALTKEALAGALEQMLLKRKNAEYYSQYALEYDWGGVVENTKKIYGI